ncbi:L,D-transpeptidase family protein [Streptomyces sp. NPDC054829]|nr:L,D-transpeptidase family protein [Streptomyces sp. SBE_14.2]
MITPNPRAAALLIATVLLAGCGAETVRTAAGTPARQQSQSPAPDITIDVAPQQLPGLGPKTWAQVPSETRQALVVTGRGKDSSSSEAVLYERTDAGWEAVSEPWPAHNALRGWTDHHRSGDLRSPIGVFSLTDAGGRLPDPGTRLPYDHGPGFTIRGTGFEGEPLEGSFDYVVAVNYNRKPGTSPLDWTRPMGAGRGGGIWIHVDHDGPTQGCVSLAEEHMRALLKALDPDLRPVVVMGDRASLAR